MAWEKTYKLGCAVEHCPTTTLGVCQYGPGYVLDLSATSTCRCVRDYFLQG